MGKLSKFCCNESQNEPEKGFCTLISTARIALWASHTVRKFTHVHLPLPTSTKGS